MSETLEAIYDGQPVGSLQYANDRITFSYCREWQEDPNAFPLSLSMPLVADDHADSAVRSFISGLLPDDAQVLKCWGKKFHVSPQNPFRMLTNVGEECAGAIQFVSPESVPDWLGDSAPSGVDWLSNHELVERIDELVSDRSEARRRGDEGHFSLAGAQAKTGLYREPDREQWAIPRGATPTTHIIKPNQGEFEDFEINEHFCLRLAAQLGLAAAKSWTEKIGQHRVIIVERYDRAYIDGRLVRIHQEDFCQALGVKPENKYQKDGGPSAFEIFSVIREYSDKAHEDVASFLNALIYNYLIAGTDGHAKNYSMLIAGGGQFRLAPLYDVASILPYQHQTRKLKLAMKIGDEYHLWKINRRHWEKAATEWRIEPDVVIEQIKQMAAAIPDATQVVRKEVVGLTEMKSDVLERLTAEISKRATTCLNELNT